MKKITQKFVTITIDDAEQQLLDHYLKKHSNNTKQENLQQLLTQGIDLATGKYQTTAIKELIENLKLLKLTLQLNATSQSEIKQSIDNLKNVLWNQMTDIELLLDAKIQKREET